jgi:hypothetical protein
LKLHCVGEAKILFMEKKKAKNDDSKNVKSDKESKDKDKKKSKKSEEPTPAPTGKKKGDNAQPPPPEEKPKTPFGNWTGKTPVTQINEWAQVSNFHIYVTLPQRYHRPLPKFEQISSGKEGFRFKVVLPPSNDKGQPDEVISLTPGPNVQVSFLKLLPIIQEAKHIAAIYALHNFQHNLNLKNVLAPNFRELWDQLTKEREIRVQQEKVEQLKLKKELKQKKLESQVSDDYPKVLMDQKTRSKVESALASMSKPADKEIDIPPCTISPLN